jgi:hypothetical protein
MGREEAQIRAAIKDDSKLFADVLQYFDADIMAMAEAQARVEGTSPASLRGPAEAYSVQVIPPAILAAQSGFGSTQSAFGTTASAFGGPPRPSPSPAAVSSNPTKPVKSGSNARTDAPPPPWQAQIIRPQLRADNAHQAALMAQRNATAEAQAVSQTSEARLIYAVQRGNEIKISN